MKPTLRSLCGLAAAFALVGPGFSTARGQTTALPPATQPSVDSLGTEFGGYRADTRPSRDSTMSYTFPVEIAKILVKGGQKVKQGDPLVQGKDDEARFQRDYQKSLADSDLDVQKAQVAMEEAQVELDGQVKLRDKKSGQEIELARAKATLDARKVDFEIAKLQYIQQKIKLNVNEAQLDRFFLKAPFDGTIDKVDTDVGEVKRETEAVLRIVSIDPLRIDVSTPTGKTLELGLKTGDPAWVFLDVPGQPAVYEGKIVELAAHADFGANERRVRIELPNPKEWPAGLAAWVRFTPPEGEWAKRIVKSEPKRAGATPAFNVWQLLAPLGGGRTELIGNLGRPTAAELLDEGLPCQVDLTF